MTKTWFITGVGRGFGLEFARSALGRGDKVAATARRLEDLAGLVEEYGDAVVPIRLDVTSRDEIRAAVEQAAGALGRLDVVVNNAGYGLFGAIEEISEQQLRDQMEVNLFGVFHVTQAVLPILRAQGSGHIVQISTIGGVAAFPTLGGYHASKWALEGLSESLAQEVAGFGIRVTLVEPGGYATDWAGSSSVHGEAMAEYEPVRAEMAASFGASEPGDPAGVGPAMLKIVDAEEPPLRVFFGEAPTHLAPQLYQQRLETWAQWSDLSRQAQG